MEKGAQVRSNVRKRNLVILADSCFDAKTVRLGDLIPPIRQGSKLKLAERIERMGMVQPAVWMAFRATLERGGCHISTMTIALVNLVVITVNLLV